MDLPCVLSGLIRMSLVTHSGEKECPAPIILIFWGQRFFGDLLRLLLMVGMADGSRKPLQVVRPIFYHHERVAQHRVQ